MEQQVLEKLKELISEGHEMGSQIQREDSYFITYSPRNPNKYEYWKTKSLRFIRIYYPDDYVELNFDGIYFKDSHDKLMGILNSILDLDELPLPIKEINDGGNSENNLHVQINNSNSQCQHQSQEQSICIFIDLIKEQLDNEQINEIKAIIEKYKDSPEKAKSSIFNKLKNFGSDVVSNVLANIITNSAIWNIF